MRRQDIHGSAWSSMTGMVTKSSEWVLLLSNVMVTSVHPQILPLRLGEWHALVTTPSLWDNDNNFFAGEWQMSAVFVGYSPSASLANVDFIAADENCASFYRQIVFHGRKWSAAKYQSPLISEGSKNYPMLVCDISDGYSKARRIIFASG